MRLHEKDVYHYKVLMQQCLTKFNVLSKRMIEYHAQVTEIFKKEQVSL